MILFLFKHFLMKKINKNNYFVVKVFGKLISVLTLFEILLLMLLIMVVLFVKPIIVLLRLCNELSNILIEFVEFSDKIS